MITLKKYTYKSENSLMTPFHTKKIITFIVTLKTYTHKSENILMIPFHTNDSHKNHHTEPPNKHCYYENKYFLQSLINLISTKQKYITSACIPKLLLKNFIVI